MDDYDYDFEDQDDSYDYPVLKNPLPLSWLDRLQEARRVRKLYDDQRHGAWEAPRDQPPAAFHPPPLMNLHEAWEADTGAEPQPKKPKTDNPGQAGQQQDPPGTAAFLANLPSFAKPAPPTPMAALVRELDADFRDLPSKLMSAINKPGSACKVLLAGGSVVRALRPKALRWPAYTSDLDFFFIASGADPAEQNNVVSDAVWTMVDAARKAFKGAKAQFRCSGRAISIYLPVKASQRMGAGMDNWEVLEVQLILRVYKSPAEILSGFDLEHCAVALSHDCTSVLTNARGLNAFKTGLACVLAEEENNARELKYAERGLCFKDLFGTWYQQSAELKQQIKALRVPSCTPSNLPKAGKDPFPVTGGAPLTDYLAWTAFKAFKGPIARLIRFNSGLNYLGFRTVDHREHLGFFDERNLFKKAAMATTERRLAEHPELRHVGGDGNSDYDDDS